MEAGRLLGGGDSQLTLRGFVISRTPIYRQRPKRDQEVGLTDLVKIWGFGKSSSILSQKVQRLRETL